MAQKRMEPRSLKKSELPRFLSSLKEQGELVAPVMRDILRFEVVDDVSQVRLDGHPLFSLKKYYHAPKRKLFSYDKEKITENLEVRKLVIFGARLCDINAMIRTDYLFGDEFAEEYYKKARANMTLVGINCEVAPKKTCFCESQELEHRGYDLFLCDDGDNYHVIVGTERGERLVAHLPVSHAVPKPIKTEKKLLKKDISHLFTRPEWKAEAEKCISCGACTNLCATCMCYDVFDEPELEMKKGSRNLEWDSCQYKDFTKVAGNHIYRDTREARLKHRVFHKLKYFKDKFGVYMCTGCGRCIEGCPTNIDFVETINKM